MFFLSKRAVYANGLQLVNRNQIPMVSEGRNHGILACFTTLQSITSENNTVRERERLVGWDGWKTRIYSPFPFSSCHSVHNCSSCINCLGKRISLLCMQGFGSQFWWAGSKVLLCHIFMMGVLRFLYDLETFMVEEQMPTSIAFHHLF